MNYTEIITKNGTDIFFTKKFLLLGSSASASPFLATISVHKKIAIIVFKNALHRNLENKIGIPIIIFLSDEQFASRALLDRLHFKNSLLL